MFINENGYVELVSKLAYSSETSTFLFWEIEKVLIPKRKIIVRLKKKQRTER